MKNKIKKIKNLLEVVGALAIVSVLSLPSKILADVKGMPSVSPADPDTFDVDQMLQTIRNYFFGIVIVACIFMILWGAFDIVMAGGDETKLKKAKDRVKYAVIGLIVGAMATAIVSLVESITKVKVN